MLRFAEELTLLLLDKESGALVPVPDRTIRCAFAAAVLMDLALENRIDSDPEHLMLVDSTPIGDDLLDPFLKVIAANNESHDTVWWIDHMAEPVYAKAVQSGALSRLVERGILKQETGDLFSLSSKIGRSRRYPMVDGEAGREVELRIMSALFANEIPSPRDAMLIALVDSCRMFDHLLSPSEQAEIRGPIDLICKLELIGRSISDAVRKADASSTTSDFSGLGEHSYAGIAPPPHLLSMEACRSRAMPLA